MKRIVIVFLVIMILCLSNFLVYNIKLTNEVESKNSELVKQINDYEKKIKEIEQNKIVYEAEYQNLNSSSKDKIQEYEKWNNWIKEIEEKMH